MFMSFRMCDIDTGNMSEDTKDSISKVKHIAYEILAPTFIIMGILGNITNLIVLGRPFIKSRTKIYLRALALADLHVCIFEVPLIIRLNEIQGSSETVAFYYAYFELVFVTTFIAFSSYVILCLTIDRYISVCAPLLYNSVHKNRKNAHFALLIAFMLAIIASVPLFIMKRTCQIIEENDSFDVQENTEIVKTFYWNAYIVTSESAIRIVPAITIAVLNILIVRKFRIIANRRKIMNATNSLILAGSVPMKKQQEKKRIMTLLVAVVILFFFTMLPSSCLSIIYSQDLESDLRFQIFRAIANLLELANSSLNFCAYFLCSSDFRTCLKKIVSHKNLSSINDKSENIQVIKVVYAT